MQLKAVAAATRRHNRTGRGLDTTVLPGGAWKIRHIRADAEALPAQWTQGQSKFLAKMKRARAAKYAEQPIRAQKHHPYREKHDARCAAKFKAQAKAKTAKRLRISEVKVEKKVYVPHEIDGFELPPSYHRVDLASAELILVKDLAECTQVRNRANEMTMARYIAQAKVDGLRVVVPAVFQNNNSGDLTSGTSVKYRCFWKRSHGFFFDGYDDGCKAAQGCMGTSGQS